MTSAQIIVLATPVFFALIGLEWAIGHSRGRNTYRLADALCSLGLGILSQVVAVFARVFTVGMYAWAHQHLALTRLDAGAPWVWVVALLGYDLCYYWQHRASHRIAGLWASHVVHHQSEDYNLSTALRQTSTSFLLAWVFYLPLAVVGVPPVVFGVAALIDLLYQYWVHTQQVGKLGWFDRWFCSPSNHRVHHAVNDRYIDRNYGGILIVWDRLFGTFAEEDKRERCVYGTRAPLASFNPLWANLQIYWALAGDSWHTRRWIDKLRVWLRPPAWRPLDVAERFPRPPFRLQDMQRFETEMTEQAQWLAGSIFLVALGVTMLFLWNAHRLPLAVQLGLATLIVAVLWLVGAICMPRDHRVEMPVWQDTV